MALNKKGVMSSTLINAILIILVMSILLLIIFRESFTTEGVDREVCSQSIYARANLPEAKWGWFTTTTFKDDYPLRCENEVVEIDKADLEKEGEAEKIIADTIASCWALFSNGDANIFPAKFYGMTTSCVYCARIHLTEEAKQYALENKKVIDFGNYLKNHKFKDGVTYSSYLRDVGVKFSPFNPAFVGEFNLLGEKFSVEDDFGKSFNGTFNKGFWAVEDFHTRDGVVESGWGVFIPVNLPRYLKADEGDLIISFGSLMNSASSNIKYVPYLYYYQIYQPGVEKELNDQSFLRWGLSGMFPGEGICESREGVVA